MFFQKCDTRHQGVSRFCLNRSDEHDAANILNAPAVQRSMRNCNKRRAFSIVLAAVLLVSFVLTGCGKRSAPSESVLKADLKTANPLPLTKWKLTVLKLSKGKHCRNSKPIRFG